MPVPAGTMSPGDAHAGQNTGLLDLPTAAMCVERDVGSLWFGTLDAISEAESLGLSLCFTNPASAQEMMPPLWEWCCAEPWPRERMGQAARYRWGWCQRRFASPDSFNINIYLNYKTPSPATYSAARLQLSEMMVTAPTDGRLVWA